MRLITGPEAEQGSHAWHAFRKNKVMASMAPIIMQTHKYESPYSLWRQLLDLDPSKEETEAMRNGKIKEPEALQVFNETHFRSFKPCVAISDQYDWLGASFDGISKYGSILEIKTPYRSRNAAEWLEKNLEIYYPQFQTQMIVANQPYCNLMIYFDRQNSFCTEIHRDQKYIDEMIPKLKEFHGYVMGMTPPPLTEKDYVRREDEEWNWYMESYKIEKVQEKITEGRLKDFRDKLIELSGGQNTKSKHGQLQKIVSKGRIDYQKIIEDYKIDVEKYRSKPSEYWRINIDVDNDAN